MSNLTISRRIALGFALVTAIAAGVGLYSINRLRLIEAKSAHMQKDSLPGSYLTAQIEILMHEMVFTAQQLVAVTNTVERAQLFTQLETNTQKGEALFNEYAATTD